MAVPTGSLLFRPCACALALCFVTLIAVRADEPPQPAAKSPSPDTAKAANRALDPAKLPPGAVIIISDNPRDALQNVEAVVMSPEEYKKLLDAAEQGRKLAAPDKPEPPSVCRLSGRVETRGAQEVGVLQAVFQFRTTAPRATVLLGLQKAKPTAATIDDGKLAVLLPLKDDEGFAVQVEVPGEHKVVVDLEVPLVGRGTKGGERGIDLGLPGAAITTLERLELPDGVSRVRVAGRAFSARQLNPVSGTTQAIVIGPVNRLDLTWDAPTPATRTDLVLAAEGRYDVRIEERVVTTQARVTLRVLGGTAGALSLLAPATAEVTPEGGGGADGSVRVERPKDPKKPVWTIRREPSADDLVLSIYLKTDIVPGKPVEVQVFPVVGASQQRGQLTVGWPTHLRLAFKPTADLTRRDGPNEASRDAVFEYYRLPESGTLLEVEAQPARGEVETLIGHQLMLAERGWRWQGKIEVRPVRTEVTVLDFDMPAELQELRPASAELVESVTPQRETAPGRRLVRVQLAEARRRSFSFTLEGLFPFNGTPGTASLPLPRCVGTMDRGGQVSATVTPGLELRGSLREWEGDRPGDWERPLDPGPRGTPGLVASVDRSPARIDLSWRSPRNDTPLSATVDVHLAERQATVRYQWRIPPGAAGARQFLLRGPAALAGRLRVEAGGVLTPGGTGEWSVQLPPVTGRDQVLTLAAGFPLPAGPDRSPVSVPLLWPQQVARCETTVRIWSGVTPSGSLVPVLAEGPWTELPPQAVPEQPSLPALVLNGVGPGLPLALRLLDVGPGPGTSLVVERIWAQALVDDDGQQAHRVRCALRPLHTHYLDVDLPAPPAAVQLAAVLDGKRLGWQPVENRAVRLRIDPDPARPVQLLELTYTLLPARIDPAQGSHWQTVIRPPRFRGPVFVGPIRWQIALPGGDLPFFLGDGAEFEQRWGWQRGLFTPQPAWLTADLRQWFLVDARPGDTSADPGDRLATTLVGWQVSSEPLRFVLVPRPLALLGGSLTVVILGLLVGRWAGSKLALLAAALLIVAIVVLGVTHPQPLVQVLYAVQPGAVVLTVLLVARRLLRGRYRRQVLLMPGFERATPTGSSLTRGVVRSRREPTTIDAPASS